MQVCALSPGEGSQVRLQGAWWLWWGGRGECRWMAGVRVGRAGEVWRVGALRQEERTSQSLQGGS